MAQYIDKSALVAWIESQKDSLERNSGCSGIFGESQMAVYDKILSFIDTLEEPTNEDLEEAAYKASLDNFVDPECLDDELHNFDWIRYYEQVFKTGALWQKRQDSLEVKDVDLEKELKDWLGERVGKWTGEECERMCLYFYELGLKAQKGE